MPARTPNIDRIRRGDIGSPGMASSSTTQRSVAGRATDRPMEGWSSDAEQPTAALSIAFVAGADIEEEATSSDVRDLIASGKLFWIDLVGGDEAARAAVLGELGVEASDLAWMQRFGQAGRMAMNPHRLRAVTWLSEDLNHGLTEIHVFRSKKMIVTIWNGRPRALDEVRGRFAERAAELEKSPPAAAAILMQLLLGTVHAAISEIDGRLQTLQSQISADADSVDFPRLDDQVQRLQSAWSDIERYSSAVKTATIGVGALPGIDERGADEWKEYADQLEDLERRLQVRSRWGQDLLSDRATAIARRQSAQISRLTVVSMIFLPLTFLTGFFGMNFPWLVYIVRGPAAFVVLGVLAPALCVITTVLWLRRRAGLNLFRNPRG